MGVVSGGALTTETVEALPAHGDCRLRYLEGEWQALIAGYADRAGRGYYVAYSSGSVHELERWLVDRALMPERLRIEEEVDGIILAIAKDLPCPESCTCQSYPTHVADGCHVHNDFPRHFMGDHEFTCPKWT